MPDFTAPDGTRLHYTDEGAADALPVLCLAGLTRNGSDFDYVAPHLKDVRLIRLDYRGRGRSDHADPQTYQIPVEAADAIALLDHLGLAKAAILGTSRGGLIAHVLAAMAKDRLLGVCLVDVGPELSREGLDIIKDYIGHRPPQKTYEDAAAARARFYKDFKGVPESRWLEEVKKHFVETDDGLDLTYDPRLREPFLQAYEAEPPDLWPLFDAFEGLPLALVRGANSDLLSAQTAAEMRRRRPDMVFADVPDRGHVPFLDEPEALAAIRAWLEQMR